MKKKKKTKKKKQNKVGGEINSYTDKKMLREFGITKPAFQ